ncbi:MAG TPA: ATP-binding protein [Terriglobia bacterium]|nr:ATP-binding protein [Terriglobia bacterium]
MDELSEVKQCIGCLHEGMLVTAADGSIIETTLGADRILESPPESLKSRNMHELCIVPGIYDDICRQVVTELRVMNRSLLVITGAGKKKLLNMNVQRVGHDAGMRFVHVFQDCSDLRSMEQRLLQSERLATVGRFASQIAHEIRNPLSSISLNVELLDEELKHKSEEASALIRAVQRELDRVNDIVSDYLQFARFPRSKLKRGQIETVIQNLVETFKFPGRIRFTITQAETTPPVWFDETLLRQVLDNLIRNAVEAIRGEGSIALETEPIGQFLIIRVRDSGEGIAADVQEKLFEPFFTTKARGTGLGLATSQQIVFDHNGHLLVESQPGKGSTFSILLPI